MTPYEIIMTIIAAVASVAALYLRYKNHELFRDCVNWEMRYLEEQKALKYKADTLKQIRDLFHYEGTDLAPYLRQWRQAQIQETTAANEAVKAWETLMMEMVGEDGPGSVRKAIGSLKADCNRLAVEMTTAEETHSRESQAYQTTVDNLCDLLRQWQEATGPIRPDRAPKSDVFRQVTDLYQLTKIALNEKGGQA